MFPYICSSFSHSLYVFALPDKLDQKNRENAIKYCLSSFKNSNLNKLNKAVYSKKKYHSFDEIPNADGLIKRLSNWNGDYLGLIKEKIFFVNHGTIKYLDYKIGVKYTLKLKQENENWYFHAIILGNNNK